MLERIKLLLQQNKIARLLVLFILIMVAFGYSNGRFVLVKAFNSQLNLYPGEVVAEQSELFGEDLIWTNLDSVFLQDVSREAEFGDYNFENSTYLVSAKGRELAGIENIIKTNEESEQNIASGTSDTEMDNASGTDETDIGQEPGEIESEVESDSTETRQGASQEDDSLLDSEISDEEISEPEAELNTEKTEEPAEQVTGAEAEAVETQNSASQEGQILESESSIELEPSPEPEAVETQDSASEASEEVSFWQDTKKKVVKLASFFNIFERSDRATAASSSQELVAEKLRQSLVFSNFDITESYQDNPINFITLSVSLAANSNYSEDKLIFEYALAEDDYRPLGALESFAKISNKSNNDYFRFPIKQDILGTDFSNLKIRVSYQNNEAINNQEDIRIFLEALWLEVEYSDLDEMSDASSTDDKMTGDALGEVMGDETQKNLGEFEGLPFELDLISEKKEFANTETPDFTFRYRKKEGLMEKIWHSLLQVIIDQYGDVALEISVKNGSTGEEFEIKPEVDYIGDGEFNIKFGDLPREFTPGKHSLEIKVFEEGKEYELEQDFTWGVLAVNTSKSVYRPGEDAYIQMAVLDDGGNTLCDVEYLSLKITDPDGAETFLSTYNNGIIANPECGPNNVIDSPDFFAFYTASIEGKYALELTAQTVNGERKISDEFYVEADLPLYIERVGPTRIYPWSPYEMVFKINVQEDFYGFFEEEVPLGFDVTRTSGQAEIIDFSDSRLISWEVDWKEGESYTLRYSFDAPNVSPEFYLLGPAKTGIFDEKRQWQIASDAEKPVFIAERIEPISTSDGSNYTKLLTASSTNFTADNDYLVYVQAGFASGGSNNNRVEYEIRYGSTVAYHGLSEPPGGTANDAMQIAWMDKYSQPSTPTDINIYFRTNNGGTTQGFNAQIMTINLDLLDETDWEYSANTASTSHTTTLATSTSLTLSDADGSKDWLVIASEEVEMLNNSINYIGEISTGGTSYMNQTREGEAATDYELIPYTVFAPFNNVAANTMFALKVADDAGPANYQVKGRIFALNLDAFEDHKVLYDGSTDTNFSDSWTEIGNLNSGSNYAPTMAGEQIVMASWINDANSSSADNDDRVQINGTTVPTNWGWTQGTANDKTTYDASDELFNNILAKYDFTTSGYTIDLDAIEVTDPDIRVADEVSMFVFSNKLKPTASGGQVENFIARRGSDFTVTDTPGWTSVPGTAENGTVASANGWIDGVNFTVGEKYLLAVWGYYNNDSASERTGMRVSHGGTVFEESVSTQDSDRTGAAYKTPYFWFTVWDASNEDIEIDIYNSTSTSRVEDVTLLAMRVTDLIDNGDLVYDIDIGTTTLNTTWAEKSNISWRANNSSDPWWIAGYTRADIVDINSDYVQAKLDIDDGTIRSYMSYEGEDSNDTPITGLGWAEEFDRGNHTVELEVRESASDEQLLASGLFALRIGAFQEYELDNTVGAQTLDAGLNNYNEIAAINPTPSLEGRWLTVGGFIADDNNGRVLGVIEMDESPITQQNGGWQFDVDDFMPFMAADIATMTNAQVDLDFDARETSDQTPDPEAVDTWFLSFPLEQIPQTITAVAYEQYRANDTVITNGDWATSTVQLAASSYYYTVNPDAVEYYFELIPDYQTATNTTASPADYCVSGTSYASCNSKTWIATSTIDNNWYDSDWTYRKSITINSSQVATTASDFVALVSVTDSDFAYTTYGGKVASSSIGDFVITDSDGTTLLPFEREYYASSTGEIALWVKIDISSTVDTSFYVYYGNSSFSQDMSTTTPVWTNGYEAVWHLDDYTSSSVIDSATDGYIGNKGASTEPTETSGQIGYAQYFDGNDYITFGDVLNAGTNDWTVEVWFEPTIAGGANSRILYNKENLYEAAAGGASYHTYAWRPHWAWDGGTNYSTPINTWSYGVVAYDHVRQYMYKDGREVYSRAQTGNIGSNTSYLQIGARGNTGHSSFFTGNIDEVRMSSVARSAGWIETNYNNQYDPSSFLTFGSREVQSDIPPAIAWVTGISASSTGYKWQVMTCENGSTCSNWDRYNPSTPNFKVDGDAPQAPGALTEYSVTSNTVTLEFGYAAIEDNFDQYKIYYKMGSPGVNESDSVWTIADDVNLDYINYNWQDYTTITGLQGGTDYYFNIYAYDLAGNKAVAATELKVTTASPGRARTVRFLAGNYIGDGSEGVWTNSSSTLPNFNFSLIESNPGIESAYIVFDTRFDAYRNSYGVSSDTYTGYKLAFDVCAEPCTADAFDGIGKVLKYDDTALSYFESSSNQVRLLLDVTNEAQLAAYSGGGSSLEAQVGYLLKNSISTSSISYVQAELVVTYTAVEAESSFTNTVIYPLVSAASGDNGTRQSVQADDCTIDSNCPLFSYNFELPEFTSSPNATRVSQWFVLNDHTDGHGAEDVFVNANIEGVDVSTTTYLHESVLGGTQSGFWNIKSDNVTGFNENTEQYLEVEPYCPTAGATHYLLGGEVYETYYASSSVIEKTRTVILPLGVLTNGETYATSSDSLSVYFPENGLSGANVTVKEAWFRILSSETYATTTYTISITSQIGNLATSSFYHYEYNLGGSVVAPSYQIIHILSTSTYSELENSTVSDPTTVKLNARHDALYSSYTPGQGGVSAELLITYTYIDESNGYLTPLSYMAGQSEKDSASQEATGTVTIIMPESSNSGTKSVVAAGLLSSYLSNDSDRGMPGNTTDIIIDANMSTTTVVCDTGSGYIVRADSLNAYNEFYKDVRTSFSVNGRETYNVCYANNGGSDSSGGAKMNSVLDYTYSYYTPQTITYVSKGQYKSDQFTAIANGAWTDEDEVYLDVVTLDTSTSTEQNFYFELIANSDTPTTTETIFTNACVSGTAFGSCASKIWTDFYSLSSSTAWYDNAWQYRKKITINASQVATTTSDFPILATTTDSNLAYTSFGGHVASSTGGDILVTDSDGETLLSFEREYYDSSTGEIVLWIKTDISSTTNKDLYIYYGNSSATTNLEDKAGVWTNNYEGVWHMDDNTTSAIYDSTGNGYTGSKGAATEPTENTGQIGYAQDFDGNDYIELGDVLDPGTSHWTVELWYKPTAVGSDNNGILYNKENLYEAAGGGDQHRYAWRPNWAWNGANTFPTSVGNWYYAALTYDNVDQVLYNAGVEVDRNNTAGSIGTNAEQLQFGCRGNTSHSSFFTGAIDEIRMSSVARSQGWLETTYNNHNNVSSFLSFALEESVNSLTYEGKVNIISIPDAGSGYKWQVLACDEFDDCAKWSDFNLPPNFKVDSSAPSTPGNLSLSTTTPTTIELNFGAQSIDTNFSEYRIYYKRGLSGVDTDDSRQLDSNLSFIDYNSASQTTLTGLEAYTQYVINIWAYDAAGNIANASEIQVTTAAAPHARSRSVKFLGGIYSNSGGISGQDTNTDQSFNTFNIELAETDISIKDAYIIFESQFEAFVNNADEYTGYKLAFDVCEEPCTADAWNGTNTVEVYDTNTLAYNEGAANQVRLLMDVASEGELSLYDGDGASLEAQIGYHIESDTLLDSIANTKAFLVLTYTFDNDNSTNITNTVYYPLDSTAPGDSGTRRNVQPNNCNKNTDCPTFNYNVEIPEISSTLSQWFSANLMHYENRTSDVYLDVNIDTVDIDSSIYLHDTRARDSSVPLDMIFDNSGMGYSANISKNLEFDARSARGAATFYLLGGEVAQTYESAKSANIKTRTVSFPLGELATTTNTVIASSSANVYFPENGNASGNVDIKSVWFRIKGNDAIRDTTYTLNVESQVGTNASSSVYDYDMMIGRVAIMPTYSIVHVIPASPSTDYDKLEEANATTPVQVKLFVQKESGAMGSVSAELMITYTYTNESTGYLSSLDLYGGQSLSVSNVQNDTVQTANAVFSELRGTKSVRAGGLLSSFFVTDNDAGVPQTFFSMGSNLATSSPVCTTNYRHYTESNNSTAEFYQDIKSAMLSTNNQTYSVCMANTNPVDTSAGAKMNSIWRYTYQWDAVPVEFTQSDWRWYENIDAIQPTTAKAAEKTAVNGLNLSDEIRLRMNLGISGEDMSASTEYFRLQYGLGSTCSGISTWYSVGAPGGTGDWTGYNNPAPNDGVTISAVLLASSTALESYEESSPSSDNPNAATIGEYGEWDWTLYNNAASSTSNYCFRMIKGDNTVLDDYLLDGYPTLSTAASNTAPDLPTTLAQTRADNNNSIDNNSWINNNDIFLSAVVTDPNINDTLTLYFEIASTSEGFTTATTAPIGACYSGTSYTMCASDIWLATSTSGDYRINGFKATTSIINLPDASSGYKWQVLACDTKNICSEWKEFNVTVPNFRVDTTPPSAPGNLTLSSTTPLTVDLMYGASTTEDNFDKYQIFYKIDYPGVTVFDSEHSDANLLVQDYNSAASTTVENLSADSVYYFNIWAFDLAGNRATATVEVKATTTPSYTPPTGLLTSVAQKTDGSGAVDITIAVDDPDNDDTLKAKIEYVPGTSCSSGGSKATIDSTDSNTVATYGDPKVDNDSSFQVGTSTGWILTSPGTNYVLFDWSSKADIPNANGTFCVHLTVNDTMFDSASTTRLVLIDNLAPSTPGNLSTSTKDSTSITLSFGNSSNDTRFSEYKIYYRAGTSTVSESDNVYDQTDDSSLASSNYGTNATTTISGLLPNAYYTFNIWAYDTRGNKASATPIIIKTNAVPTNISADAQYRNSNLSLISNSSWIDENGIVFTSSAHDQDSSDLLTFYYEVITATGTYSAATAPPLSTCAYNSDYLNCSSNIWAVATTVSALPSDWYDKDWLYRKTITLNANRIATTALDFTVLATTTDSDLASKARTDGYDIVFTDSDGISILPFEREYYNPSTGELVAWIKTDISSTTDTDVYMYYGNSQWDTDLSSTANVWDDNYRGVWHLNENVVDESTQVDAHSDSSGTGNNGQQNANNEVSALFAQGQEFDGNDYITVSDNDTIDVSSNFTLSAWLNVSAGTDWKYLRTISFSSSTPQDDFQVMIQLDSSFDYSKTQTNGEDLRFYDESDVACDYWIEEWNNSGDSTIWVNVPDSGTTELSMYYGNSGATEGSNGTSTFEFFDQFAGSDLDSKWQVDANDYAVSGGALRINIGGVTMANPLSFNMEDNYIVESRMMYHNTTGSYSGTLSAQSSQYTAGGNSGAAATNLYMRSSTNLSHWTGNGAASSYNCSSGTVYSGTNNSIWYILGSVYDSSGVTLQRNRNTGSSYGCGWTKNINYVSLGYFTGSASGDAHDTSYDWLLIRKHDTGEPTATIGDERLAGINKAGAYSIAIDNSTAFGTINDTTATATVSSGWNHIVLTYDRNLASDQQKLFVNGRLADTATLTGAINNNTNDLIFGDLLNGLADEVSLASTTRSAAWVSTNYNNQINNSFLSYSTEERVVSYYETMLVLNLPDNPSYSSGYKWQIMVCDDDNECSSWGRYNSITPNFKIDTTNPNAPGALSQYAKTSNNVTLSYGAETIEDNFTEYKIYYSTSTSISESDYEFASSSESALSYIDYNSETDATISGLLPDTDYYFNIWAYDIVGHKASSTIVNVRTDAVQSSPGVAFYTKGTSTIWYRVWNGTAWEDELAGPSFSGWANDEIRHVRTVRSDDKGKVAVVVVTHNTASTSPGYPTLGVTKWWGTVFRFAAGDFVDTTQLLETGAVYEQAADNQSFRGCLAPISSGEFMLVKNDSTIIGYATSSVNAQVYTWSSGDGWVYEGTDITSGNLIGNLAHCDFVRRPDTDNYLLITYDSGRDSGTAYYKGSASYDGEWTAWTEHSSNGGDNDNINISGFFDPNDNTLGAITYSNETGDNYAVVKKFIAGDSSINYAGTADTGIDWNADYITAEISANPGGDGTAYFVGADESNPSELNAYKIDISGTLPTWTMLSAGDDFVDRTLYRVTNDTNKSFDIKFYKDNKALVVWNYNGNSTPNYNIVSAVTDIVQATTTVTGAASDLWTRVRLTKDPDEEEIIAIYQNDNTDYAAAFFSGASEAFYSAGAQSWTTLSSANTVNDRDDENISFSFSSYNTAPNSPASLTQRKSDGSTLIANAAWTNETTVNFNTSVIDPDTDDVVRVYLNLVLNTDDISTSTDVPISPCASTTAFSACNSKIWLLATSTAGDYSETPFTVSRNISGLASSTIGYKWQVKACDDEPTCSSWVLFNATQPNFYVDDLAPSAPGSLSDISVTSDSVTLQFGSASVEDNFSEYKIFYKEGSSGVSDSDSEWSQVDDSNLSIRTYSGNTTITGLASSTQYVFNIFAYDLAGNIASATTEVSTTTSDLPNIEQVTYIFENDDGVNVNDNTNATTTATALTSIYKGERLIARIQIENNGGDATGNRVYKLQFDTNSDDTWVDVGAATAISYTAGLSGSNGQALSGEKLANGFTWKNGTWHESTGLSGSYDLPYNQYTEFAFMLDTGAATVGSTYRLRLFNDTDSLVLDDYTLYPTLTVNPAETIKYSKGAYASLPTTAGDLIYYLDPLGYENVSSDNSVYDTATSSSNQPITLFATKHSNDSDAIAVTWNGQSSVAASSQTIYLQVYSYGSPNQWITLASSTSAVADTDFTLSSSLNSSLSTYYDSSDWTYWRVYQDSTSAGLRTDYYNIGFSAPVPDVSQLHYRWRNDNGTEVSATWREDEDEGDPTLPTVNIDKNENIRLRIETANTGGGSASNYQYRLEYATSTGICTGLTDWYLVADDWSTHWHAATSTNVNDDDATVARLNNTEGHTYTAGKIVASPDATSSTVTLTEDRFTEIEYVINATANADIGGSYCFRVTNAGTLLDNYSVYPVITVAGITNYAPTFSVYPIDNGSASSSPTDYGNTVTFDAQAGDVEGDDYYLAICKTNSIFAGNDGPPTCGGAGAWCISDATASGTDATCDYSTAEASEENDWYAYVCDKKVGFGTAKCSAYSQGQSTITNNSPFAINHQPVFSSVVTSNDNQDPGSTFRISASVTESDTFGGTDSVRLWVCDTNSANYDGCGGTVICSVSATTSPNPYCTFVDTAPTAPGDYEYYAFVFDSHELGASDNSRLNTYTINNTVPTLGTLVLNGNNDITLNMRGAGDTDISTVNANIYDPNGCSSLVSATAVIYMTNNSFSCTQDNNDCYQIGVGGCGLSDCSGGTDMTATFTCTTSMKYYTSPTDNSNNNPNETYQWLSYMQIYDGSNYIATTSDITKEIEVKTSLALVVNESLVDFGDNFSVGDDTGSSNSTTTIVNSGNSPIDTNLSGTDMTGVPSGTITVDNIRWDMDNFDYSTEGTSLTSGGQIVDIEAPKATSTDVIDKLYWGIGIPYGTDRSTFNGTNIFDVILDNDNW